MLGKGGLSPADGIMLAPLPALSALTGALQRCFGQCLQPGKLSSQLRNRELRGQTQLAQPQTMQGALILALMTEAEGAVSPDGRLIDGVPVSKSPLTVICLHPLRAFFTTEGGQPAQGHDWESV
ncbi:unnamed protein product [Boreogadus saida]